MLDTQRVDQIALTLSRLNGIWSPSGQPLCWQIDIYLRPMPLTDVGRLLQCVTAYGCLARHAGEYKLSSEWIRLFNDIGQALIFDMPESLLLFERREFESLYGKAFVEGFSCVAPPPPSPP